MSKGQKLAMHPSWSGRTLTLWADLRSIHVVLEGRLVKTVVSRLSPEDLPLTLRGARPAGPAPAPAALARACGAPTVPGGQVVEIDRRVSRDGTVGIAGADHQIGTSLAGRTITLRLDGRLIHAIAGGALADTWPCPIPRETLPTLRGIRAVSTPLPPPQVPAG
ncbi:hypothetical protein [Nocardia salmonicida]|uniref:hypothetical protein n=1 Tax=Nocardia salmonicida TaxID=53431 RepID=UPI0007A4B4B4|nr:hypothetical protein [Nocardia salmonicida]